MSTQSIDYAALAKQAGAIQSQPGGMDYAALAKQAGAISSSVPGQQTNDVGNTVIVPQDGESFQDTMRRAAAYGKTVTPGQINAEMRTAPAKAAETLAAAPAIGAVGTAALAGVGEGASNLPRAFQGLKNVLPDQATADQVIKVGKMIRDLSLTAAAGKYLYHAIYGEEKGEK
jgi:hypothetical protein